MPPSDLNLDYYAILSIPHSASPADIKLAYHRALLLHHPDKQSLRVNGHREANGHAPIAGNGGVDIGLIQKAYATLSSPDLRAEYDARRMAAPTGPRPAQVVSLEEFTEGEEGMAEEGVWTYACRCGGRYTIRETEMERDEHLVGCSGCSEVVWVGYEVAEDDDADGED